MPELNRNKKVLQKFQEIDYVNKTTKCKISTCSKLLQIKNQALVCLIFKLFKYFKYS